MRIVVLHEGYGCETGCCGHIVEVDGKMKGDFTFDHPGDTQTAEEFAENLVREICGDDHVKDLVWEECRVYDD